MKTCVLFLAAALLLGLTSCVAPPAAPASLPTDTPTPSPPPASPTPTVVWFPPTATPSPFPTPVVSPTLDLRPSPGPVIFRDNFDDPTVWALARTSATSIALGADRLTLAMDQPGGYLYTLRQGPLLSDFYLEITAAPSLCRGEDEYGLLLRVSPDLEFYRFSLSCNGQVRLDKYYQGTASSPQPWLLSGAFPPGAPSRARLGVLAQGKELRFYVNGEFQFAVRDPSLQQGSLGLFIRSAGDNALTVSFSELTVFEPGR